MCIRDSCSPSMYVTRLLHAAVLVNAGSYVINPKSSGAVLIWRRSMARIAPFSIGISYVLPVRLSTILRVCRVGSMIFSTLRQVDVHSIQRRPSLVASHVYNGVPATPTRGGHRRSRLPRLYLFLATSLSFPALYLKLTGMHVTPGFEALLFGLAILGAAFLLSWAAEVAQKDISQALAVAILALIAVLPEYAVDMVFAWKAGRQPEYAHYALANMTGANRLLVGVGWPAVVLLFALRFRKAAVKLEPAHRVEILFMGLATCYAI